MAPERCARCGSRLDIPTDRAGVATPIVRAPTNRGEAAQRAAGIFAVSLVPHRPAGSFPPAADAAGPASGAPAYGAPADGAPAYGAPADGAPAYGAPAYGAPAYGAPAYGAPASGVPASAEVRPLPPVGATARRSSPESAPSGPAAVGAAEVPAAPEVRYPALGPRPTWAPPDATQVSEVRTDPATGPARTSAWATQAPPPPAASSGMVAATGQASPVDVTAAFPSVSGTDPGSHGSRDQLPATDAARSAEEPDDARHRTVRPGVDASWPPPPGPWSGRRTSES